MGAAGFSRHLVTVHDRFVKARLARFAHGYRTSGLDPELLDPGELLRMVARAATHELTAPAVDDAIELTAADAVDGLRLLASERARLDRYEVRLIEAAIDHGETWESLGARFRKSRQAMQQHYRHLGGRRRWPVGRRRATAPTAPVRRPEQPRSDTATRLSPAIEAVCGPQTGVTHLSLENDARAHQDYLATDTLHGPVPRWEDLDDEQRQHLIDHRAMQLRAKFDTPPPDNPAPIDHVSPSSPPYPRGLEELRFWHTRISHKLAENIAMRDGQDDHAPAFLLGRVAELEHWQHEFAEALYLQRAHPGGSAEVASWIVWAEHRVTLLTDQCERTSSGLDQGHLTEATDWLRALRWRQQAKAHPDQWQRGGRGLLAALRAADRLTGHGLNDDVVVIAAHDHHHIIVADRRRDVIAVLRDWTGQSEQACTDAIRQAHANGLVEGRTEADVQVTTHGSWRYQQLLTAAKPG